MNTEDNNIDFVAPDGGRVIVWSVKAREVTLIVPQGSNAARYFVALDDASGFKRVGAITEPSSAVEALAKWVKSEGPWPKSGLFLPGM